MLRSLRSAPRAAEAGIHARWYSPLLHPVMPTVSRALVELEGPADPWKLPRTGLGGAVVIQVARGFDVRRWRRGARVAVTALEGYNQRVHIGEPGEPQRARWLACDLGAAKKLWDSLLEHDQRLVNRVIDRLLGPGGRRVISWCPRRSSFFAARSPPARSWATCPPSCTRRSIATPLGSVCPGKRAEALSRRMDGRER